MATGLARFSTEKEDAAYLAQVEASDKGRPNGAAGLSNLATPEGQSPLDTPKRFNSPSPQDELEKVSLCFDLFSNCGFPMMFSFLAITWPYNQLGYKQIDTNKIFRYNDAYESVFCAVDTCTLQI